MHIFHDWIQCGREEIIWDKRGPFDPRSDEQRTYNREMEVCAKCGKKREYVYPDPGICY